MADNLARLAVRENAALKASSNRKCTDCGKPTANYRCEACWKKRRGFGFDDTATDDATNSNSPEYKKTASVATQRREKPKPSVRDGWQPLAPRVPFHDRQAEYFANKEKDMPRKLYTPKELAELVGVPAQVVHNAKFTKPTNPRPGSAMGKVVAYMQENGILWAHVVASRKVEPACEATPAPASVDETPVQKLEAMPWTPEAPSASPNKKQDIDILDLSPTLRRLTEEAASAEAEVCLGHIPLETLVGEITRRFPRAEVVLR